MATKLEIKLLLLTILIAMLGSAGFAQENVPAPSQAEEALSSLRGRLATDSGLVSWNSGVYQYDPAGNITAIGTESFLYDKVGRLKSAEVLGPDRTTMNATTMTYDVYGNMINWTRPSRSRSIPVSTSTNRLTSGEVVYDGAGNVITWNPTGSAPYNYAYDAAGMVKAIEHDGNTAFPDVVHVYTADDERLWTYDVNANESHWKIRSLDNKVLRDFKVTGSTWTVDRNYGYREGTLLASFEGLNELHFTVDHLGTPRFVTNRAKEVVASYAYYPFGDEIGPSVTNGESMKFTGHERDEDPRNTDPTSMGTYPLDYMHARYYSPELGRFMAVDPGKDWNLQNPQSWNMFTYVRNNPVNMTDPTGRCGEPGSFIGPRKRCSQVAKEWLSKGGQAAVKFIASHDHTMSWGVGASFMGGVIGGGLDARLVADSRGTVGLRFSAVNRFGVGASAAVNVSQGVELNGSIKRGLQQGAQITVEGGDGVGISGSVGLDSNGDVSVSKDVTVRAGVEAGGAVSLDGVTSYTFAINVLGRTVESAEAPAQPRQNPPCLGGEECHQ